MGNKHKTSFPTLNRVSLAIALLAALLAACSPVASPQIDAITATTGNSINSGDPNTQVTPTGAEIPIQEQLATNTPVVVPDKTAITPLESQPVGSSEPQPDANQEIDFGTADLAIIRPGQLSRHTSPIRVIANLDTILPLETEITLYGEDGRVLASKTLWSNPYSDPINGNLITDIEFSLPGMVETGRLEIKAFESTGRIWALNSVYQILLSSGITDRNYAQENQDRILLQLPFPDQRQASSSPIFVSGLVRTDSDKPLTIQLVDEAGNVVGEGQAPVVLSPGSPYGQFVGEIPYHVDKLTQVLMTFGLQEGRIPGFTYIKTIPFTLIPGSN
jgi:hypothetical protein